MTNGLFVYSVFMSKVLYACIDVIVYIPTYNIYIHKMTKKCERRRDNKMSNNNINNIIRRRRGR